MGEREVGGLVGVGVGAVLRERALWAGGTLPCWAALVLALVLAAGAVGGGRACTIRPRRRGRLGCCWRFAVGVVVGVGLGLPEARKGFTICGRGGSPPSAVVACLVAGFRIGLIDGCSPCTLGTCCDCCWRAIERVMRRFSSCRMRAPSELLGAAGAGALVLTSLVTRLSSCVILLVAAWKSCCSLQLVDLCIRFMIGEAA